MYNNFDLFVKTHELIVKGERWQKLNKGKTHQNKGEMMTEDRTAPIEDERSFASCLTILIRNALCYSINKL